MTYSRNDISYAKIKRLCLLILQDEITDKEFEKILMREERQLPKYKQKKPKGKKPKTKKKTGLKNVRRLAGEQEDVCFTILLS